MPTLDSSHELALSVPEIAQIFLDSGRPASESGKNFRKASTCPAITTVPRKSAHNAAAKMTGNQNLGFWTGKVIGPQFRAELGQFLAAFSGGGLCFGCASAAFLIGPAIIAEINFPLLFRIAHLQRRQKRGLKDRRTFIIAWNKSIDRGQLIEGWQWCRRSGDRTGVNKTQVTKTLA